jgi:hypothetical protein
MKTAIHRFDDDEFLGYIDTVNGIWQAQTIFGYPIARVETKKDAEAVLREQGLGFLKGTWQYYDRDEHDWFPCIVKDASEQRVTIIRTNALGYQDPDVYKLVVLKSPDENMLIKSA